MIFQNVFRDHVVIYLPLLLHLHHQVMHADHHNGLVTIIVTMKTTMRNVDGTVEIAVGIMSTHNTALLVNV